MEPSSRRNPYGERRDFCARPPSARDVAAVGPAFYFWLIMIVEMKIFPAIEKEAIGLALEARDFLRRSKGKDLHDIRLRFLVCERVHWVVAWVLYQKAILAGETTWSKVRRELSGMAGRPPAHEPVLDEGTDPALRALAEKSAALFSRVQRLLQTVPAPLAGDRPGIERTIPTTQPSGPSRPFPHRQLH